MMLKFPKWLPANVAAHCADKLNSWALSEGSEPTPDEQEKIDAMGDSKVMVVVFGKPDPNRFTFEGNDHG